MTNGQKLWRVKYQMKMTASDICNILKACHEANVASFTLGKLQVTFKGIKSDESSTHMEVGSFELQDLVSRETTEKEEIAHKDDELARLELEDPAAYEKAVLSGDMLNSRVGVFNEDDSGTE